MPRPLSREEIGPIRAARLRQRPQLPWDGLGPPIAAGDYAGASLQALHQHRLSDRSTSGNVDSTRIFGLISCPTHRWNRLGQPETNLGDDRAENHFPKHRFLMAIRGQHSSQTTSLSQLQ